MSRRDATIRRCPTRPWSPLAVAFAALIVAGCREKSSPDKLAGDAEGTLAYSAEAARIVSSLRSRFMMAGSEPLLGNRADAKPVSVLAPGLVARFGLGTAGVEPHFADEAERPSARVVLPKRAAAPMRLEDAKSGASVDVSLVGARDVAAEAADGYVVYPGGHASGATILHHPMPTGTEDFLSFESRPSAPTITYRMALQKEVRGLRLVANTLEMLDAAGAPRLRVAPPYIVGADGVRTDATLSVEGCAVDTNPAGPWGRDITPPGAETCTVRVSWNDDAVAYPALLDPRWTTTGPMAVARMFHASVLLAATGKVLVTGGAAQLDFSLGIATAELFDPTTNTWATTNPMATPRQNHTATQLGTTSNPTTSGKVLVAGGRKDGTGPMFLTELYNPLTGMWAAGASMNTSYERHSATVLSNGHVLVTGGMSNNTSINGIALKYDPNANPNGTWSILAFDVGTLDHTATLLSIPSNPTLHNKLMIVGGRTFQGTSTTTVRLYDLASGFTISPVSLPSAREQHTATRLNDGKVLVVGGTVLPKPDPNSGNNALDTAVLFDPTSGFGTWVPAGTMSVPRFLHSASLMPALASGEVMVAGGMLNGDNLWSSIELFTRPSTWTVATATPMPDTRAQHTATTLNTGGVLIAGGLRRANPPPTAITWIYTPNNRGLPCTQDSQCDSQFCRDGVCCNSSCSNNDPNSCVACNLSGSVGTCSNKTAGTTCTNDNNACTVDRCDGGGACSHPAGNAGTVCRTAAGPCDNAEACTGTSTACPADTFLTNTTVCRASAGVCDAVEKCTGSSATCPADAFLTNSTVCRASAGVCDAAETCTGASAACPADALLPNTTVCRASAGVCDALEKCTGSSAACPADAFLTNSTVCRAAAGVCDTAETCTGASAACPADALLPNTTVCRVAAGVCDAVETCTGASTACPADTLVPSTTVCRAAAGVCDAAETCTGASVACPADALLPSTTVCRAAGGVCDAVEKCTGSSATCPADALLPSTTVCRAAAGVCDAAETCTGASVACPADARLPSTTVCRAAAGACDAAETCTGASTACPTDAFLPSTTVCRASGGVCDVAENCTGGSASCPTDAFLPSSTLCRAAAGICDLAETCTGSVALCPPDGNQPNGNPCTGTNKCLQSFTCQNGACLGSNPVVCAAADRCHAAGTCDVNTGLCSNPSQACCGDNIRNLATEECDPGNLLGTPACTADCKVDDFLAVRPEAPVRCQGAACCPVGAPILQLSGSDSFTDSTANACIVATDAGDAIYSGGPNSTVIARGGGDLIVSSGGGSRLYGGEGVDVFHVSNGGYVVPGPGRDSVTCDGECTVAIASACEIESDEHLDGGGAGTLITPLPVSELTALGVSVTGFSTVRIEQHACESLCVTPPDCSGHGVCAEGDAPGQVKCACFPGFTGTHCSDGFVKTKRALGAGRHTVAASNESFGVAFVEEAPSPTRVRLQVLGLSGDAMMTTDLSAGGALLQSNPVVAAMQGGVYAVAWNDFGQDGDELGVALQLVDASSPVPGPVQYANTGRGFSQQDPDIIWTGTELVVAWVDGSNVQTAPDIRYRRFGPDLAPMSDQTTLADAADAEGDVALARFAGSWAAAWRSTQNGLDTIRVQTGTTQWSVGPMLPGDVDDKPALAEIDSTHLLLVYTEGTDPLNTGVANVSALRAAVLDLEHPGSVPGLAVYPLAQPTVTDPLAQTHPNAIRVGNDLYIAWRSQSVRNDALAEELWLKPVRLSTTNSVLDLASVEVRFPRRAEHRPGDQRHLALADLVRSAQDTALVSAWDDLGAVFGPTEGHGDVVAQIAPLPLSIVPPTEWVCDPAHLATDAHNCGSCGHDCLGGPCSAGQCQAFPFVTGFGGPMGVAVVGADVYVLDSPNFTIAPYSESTALIRIAPNGTKTVLESGMLSGGSTLWFDAPRNAFVWPDFFGFIGPEGLTFHILTRPLEAPTNSVTEFITNHLAYPFGIATNADSVFIANWGFVQPGNLRDTVERRPRGDLMQPPGDLTQYTTFFTPDTIPHPSHMDLDADYLYWAETQTGRIRRRPLAVSWDAGAALEEITTVVGNTRGIAVDGATIYFTTYGGPAGPPPGRVFRVANQKDAPTPAVVIATIPGAVEDVAVDAKAIYIAGHGSGTLWKMAK